MMSCIYDNYITGPLLVQAYQTAPLITEARNQLATRKTAINNLKFLNSRNVWLNNFMSYKLTQFLFLKSLMYSFTFHAHLKLLTFFSTPIQLLNHFKSSRHLRPKLPILLRFLPIKYLQLPYLISTQLPVRKNKIKTKLLLQSPLFFFFSIFALIQR